ncbi:MAG: hypothetical protein ACPG30_07360 [Parvibaculales bacterium]
MTKISLWVLSAGFLVYGAAEFFILRHLAALPLLILGLYLLPPIRGKVLVSKKFGFLAGWLGTSLIVTLLVVTYFSMMVSRSANEEGERIVEKYNTNPEVFIESVKKDIEQKDFFSAKYELDRLIPRIVENELLKSLRHQITMEEIQSYADDNKLHHFGPSELSAYRKLMGDAAQISELQDLYLREAKALVEREIEKEETLSAQIEIDRLQEMFPANDVVASLVEYLDSVKKTLRLREEALAKKRAEQDEARRTAEERANLTSEVVGKVGGQIFLANGLTLAIDWNGDTIFHIDGQMYPKGTGNPDLIQIGYRCRAIGGPAFPVEVFCER